MFLMRMRPDKPGPLCECRDLETEPLARIDYVEVVDFENIQRTPRIEGETLVAIAVYIGKTRLIDNFIVNI